MRGLSGGCGLKLVDKILLTGGSSLLPKVREKIAEVSGHPASLIVSKQPHQAVAFGAAIIAHNRQKQSDDNNNDLQRISAYDLGIRVMDKQTRQPVVQKLIQKNTPVPAEQSTLFYTTRPDQARMVIEVVQQKAPGVEEKSLGHFAFGPIEKPRKNYPVEIHLGYDLEGLVKVTAKDPETGKRMQQIMEQDGQRFDSELNEQRSWIG